MQTNPGQPQARLFWDAGGIWSLMAFEAVTAAGLAISPITAAELRAGGLHGAGMLMVPGGWAALKTSALGEQGGQAIRDFVARGGSYLGFCGGAGLALAVDDGLGLLPLGRKSKDTRLPSLSGPVLATPTPESAEHPFWRGIQPPAAFHVWWPGQFGDDLPEGVKVIARYQGPAPGLCSSDMAVDHTPEEGWELLEARYNLRLDPAPLAGEPAVLEASYGRGRLLLSYLHLDTPHDPWGSQALANLWLAWLGQTPREQPGPALSGSQPDWQPSEKAAQTWEHGCHLGLWRQRHAFMPLWRRGARGLEFWSVFQLCRALARWSPDAARDDLAARLDPILAPLWDQAGAVLEEQGRRLGPIGMQGKPRDLEAEWFPAPRRTGGALAPALAALEGALLEAIRERRPET